MTLFDSEIEVIKSAMQARLIEKQEKHGDSWKIDSITKLRIKTNDINYIMQVRRGTDKEMIGLVDMANQCMLLYLRLKGVNNDKN